MRGASETLLEILRTRQKDSVLITQENFPPDANHKLIYFRVKLRVYAQSRNEHNRYSS